MFALRSHVHLLNCSSLARNSPKKLSPVSRQNNLPKKQPNKAKTKTIAATNDRQFSRRSVTVGLAAVLMGLGRDDKALAFGPEGPLMEEFWDNVRRYALYALTVSTGALYAVFEPLSQLFKNPISAILVLVILVGGFYILTQVVTAMIGLGDFSYDYSY